MNAQQQAFQLQNDGIERWPNGCYLTSPIQTQRINVPSLRPGETCDILADLMPTQPAIMWRMCTPNGWYFGGESQLQLNLNLNLYLQQIIICICSRSSSVCATDHHQNLSSASYLYSIPNHAPLLDAIWMIPPGTQASQDELQQRMVQLITSESKPEFYPQINIVITAHTQ